MDITKNESGLTLIEILAATSILTIVILMFVNLSGYTMLTTQKDDQHFEALQIAERTINHIREMAAENAPESDKLEQWLASNFNEKFGIYSIEATASNDLSSAEHSVSLSTAIITTDSEANSAKRPATIFVTVNWGKINEE